MDRTRLFERAAAILLVSAVLFCAFGCFPAPIEASVSPVPTAEPTAVDIVEPTPDLTAAPTSEPTPTPDPTPTPEPTPEPTATPTPLPEGYLTEEEKLRLVNFEYRLETDYEPHDMVIACQYLKGVCSFKYTTTQIQIEVADQLRLMLEAAAEEGVAHRYFLVNSYRAQWIQRRMWQKRIDANPHYGDDPYKYPVGTMPGNASEHCAGLAIDITSEYYPYVSTGYGKTAEAIWMKENAHRFGFILRYPAEKEYITGVHYEPWHFRYVGVEAATEIYERGLCLEEYLGLLPPYLTGSAYASSWIAALVPDDKGTRGV